MKNYQYTPSRRGFGAIFIFVIGIVVVMTIFLMTQFMSGKTATAEIEASDLGNRAQIVAESAAEECSYYVLNSCNNDEEDDSATAELYEKLRTFDKESSTHPSVEGPTGKGLKYLWNVPHEVPVNRGYYQSSENTDNIDIGNFVIGPVKQNLFPEEPVKGNESSGILAMEGEITVNSKSGGISVQRQVQFARDFRVVLLHPPYPFNNYTLFLKRTSPSTADRFHSYFEKFEGAGNALSQSFPIEDMASDSRPIVTTASEIRPESFAINSLSEAATVNISNMNQTESTRFNAELNSCKGGRFRKLSPETSQEYVTGNYYNQLDYKSFRNRASHYYPDFGRFIYNHQKDDVLRLNGLYYIEKGVSLNHVYSGRGIIVTSSTEDLVIRSLSKSSESDRLTVVTINSNFDIQYNSTGSRTIVQADIMAVAGTILRPGAAVIEGCVYLSHLPPDNNEGLHIKLPPDTATTPWSSGDTPDKNYLKKLSVLLNPGYAWRKYWNKRR